MLRLEQTNIDLFNKLKNMDEVNRKKCVLNVINISLQSLGLNDNLVIHRIINQIGNGKYPCSDEVKSLKEIQDGYENEYFDKQERNDEDYLVFFSKARATNALMFLCENKEESVYESAYEILMTVDEQEDLLKYFVY
jgi:hypothetical protein